MRSSIRFATLAVVTLLAVASPGSLISTSLLPASAQTTHNRKAEADQLLQQGIQQYRQGKSQEALKTFQAAIALFKQLGDRENEWRALGWIGTVYGRLGQMQKALELHQQALILAREIRYRSGEVLQL